ncbi:MAG: NADH-quinone oxidoreductase subunit H, partial [Candidatus Obscuribacter sp.]|nr:NADH-quinone oxidoreductase subunit H [Candidatus Obscuribacter sp.]
GVTAGTSDLTTVFSFENVKLQSQTGLWFIAGCGLFLSSLVELSRMPADDPTTHLELTMVHEAMILENSATNLALAELTHFVKIVVLLGISSQCFLHSLPWVWQRPKTRAPIHRRVFPYRLHRRNRKRSRQTALDQAT